MTEKEYKDIRNEYREKFGEPFPLYMVLGMEMEQIAEIIKKCIKSGKPYDPDEVPGALY